MVTLGTELLDGPWVSREAAAQRAEEIQQQQSRPATVVEVAADGVSVIREEKHAG